MKKICKNCRWWGEASGYETLPSGEGHRVCAHPKVGGGGYEDDLRKGPDALNSYESIGTGPEFGCVHWKSRS